MVTTRRSSISDSAASTDARRTKSLNVVPFSAAADWRMARSLGVTRTLKIEVVFLSSIRTYRNIQTQQCKIVVSRDILVGIIFWKASMPAYEEIKPVADDLLMFIDETGHETFAGDQGFYGLGGCLTTGSGYEYLKLKWRDVRKVINGNSEAPLHGSDITANPKPESFAALRTFFEDRSFVRIAVTTTRGVGLPAEMHPCVAVSGQLWQEIGIVAAALASELRCKRSWIILESSDRADPVVKRSFGQLTSLNAQQAIHVEHCLMPKSANEPGLEVADFIISAAGSEVQRRLRGKTGHAPDFNDVFGRLPADGARYREITRVTVHANGRVSIDGVRLAQAT
jgi:hypothetical protein